MLIRGIIIIVSANEAEIRVAEISWECMHVLRLAGHIKKFPCATVCRLVVHSLLLLAYLTAVGSVLVLVQRQCNAKVPYRQLVKMPSYCYLLLTVWPAY